MTNRKKPDQFNLLEWADSFEESDEEPISDPLSCETPVIEVDTDSISTDEVESPGEEIEPIEAVMPQVTNEALTEPAPYGYCSCGRAIKIPGLEAHLCPKCGWRTKSR